MTNLLPSTKKYLGEANKQLPLYTMTPEEVRRMRATAQKPNNPSQNNLLTIVDRFITVRDGENIKIRLYSPVGEGPYPIIIYYHGGGWVLNDLETCDLSCQLLAATTKSIVVSVEYRLAPEYKFPIPVYDAFDAFLWTANHAPSFNGLTSEITVMGDSAGANLATVVTLMNKELGHDTKIASQVLLYPVTKLSYDTPSYTEFAEGYGLERKDMQWFGEHYLNTEEEKNDQYVSPLLADNLSDLPTALVIVAEYDVLRDEGIAYVEKLRVSGVEVEQQIAKGLVHSFFTKNEAFAESIIKTVHTVNSFLQRTRN